MTLPIRIRMTARSIDEPHRTASPLELLFDLTFVIAVAALTSRFAHAVEDGHALDALVPFLQVFFAIWWAWMNYTWFASSFDTDDVPFRLLTLVQMAGVLVLAAGVPAALEDNDYRAVTFGYLIMRVGLIAHWLRAAIEDPASRTTALRYVVGITVAEVGWVLRLVFAEAGVLSADALLAMFVALVLFELAVPLWAERKRPTSWHPHHIAERHGLFAIILLGESVLAASTGVQRVARGRRRQRAAREHRRLPHSCWSSRSGGCTSCSRSAKASSRRRERSYVWGYGHYGVFAALAAVGAGLEAAVVHLGHHVATSAVAVALRHRGPGGRVPHARVGAARAAHRPAGAASVGDARWRRRRPAAPARRTRPLARRRSGDDRRRLRSSWSARRSCSTGARRASGFRLVAGIRRV